MERGWQGGSGRDADDSGDVIYGGRKDDDRKAEPRQGSGWLPMKERGGRAPEMGEWGVTTVAVEGARWRALEIGGQI